MTSLFARPLPQLCKRPVRRALLAASIAAAALTFGIAPTSAQQRGGTDYGFEAPPGPRFNPNDISGRGALPNVNAQERIAARVEAREFESPRQLLRAAADAVRGNNWGRANELLERAETDVLNIRSVNMASARGGRVVNTIGNARNAVVRADPRDAMNSIRNALSRLDQAQMMAQRDRFGRDQFERGYRAGRDQAGMQQYQDRMSRYQSWRDSRDSGGGGNWR